MIDWRLAGPLAPLFGLSLAVLTSLSPQWGMNQLIFIILGAGVFWLVGNYPYRQHRFFQRHYFIAALILLVLPYLFGAASRGAVRWIPVGGLTVQPSELIKPALILVFAAHLVRGPRLPGYLGWLLPPLLLIAYQPDLGTALVVAAVWLGLLLVSRVSCRRWLLILIGLGLLLPLVWTRLQPYQKLRLTGFLNPYADPAGSGYQVIQSLIAAGSGGLLGQGLGRGSQSQLRFLPEGQTDFVFAVLVENLGFAGGAGLLVSYGLLLRRLITIAAAAKDEFGRLITAGVAVLIWFQAVVTVGMNLGWLPVTGITLPLVSAGGSSLVAMMAGLGLANSVWKFSRSSL